MTKEWSPSALGRFMTGSVRWRASLQDLRLHIDFEGRSRYIDIQDERAWTLNPGRFWTDLLLDTGSCDALRLGGLSRRQGRELADAIDQALHGAGLQADVTYLRQVHQATCQWLALKSDVEGAARRDQRWLSRDLRESLEAARPALDFQQIDRRLDRSEIRRQLGSEVDALQQSLLAFETDVASAWAGLNEAHVVREMHACRAWFESVERQPLSEEQVRAVVCFDNRVQLVAAAGSGKTSTMVAKAAYAIKRGLAEPGQIVMLAFNKQAALELKERTTAAFERLGLSGIGVDTATFHALGLKIIGLATGRKPDIPDWAIDVMAGLDKLAELVDDLKDRSEVFRERYDLFRFVYGRDLPAFGLPDTDGGRSHGGQLRLPTIDGKWVRSQEEAMIANWLFYNGVEYQYETSFRHDTADAAHRQYKPDFFYPGIDLHHEHFALDGEGRPPPDFDRYLEGVVWKRSLHQRHGTALIETTSHQCWTGAVFGHLAQELLQRGVSLDPHPDRAIPQGGQPPLDAAEMLGLIRTFMSHAKSNGLGAEALRERLDQAGAGIHRHRHQMFLDLVIPVMEAWDAALAAEGGIDFEDMLNRAAEHLEQAHCKLPYTLVMADEFQDASRARARLCRAMVDASDRYFFAVGDDWQSINRFAGADISVMANFQEYFGHGQMLRLERTFRCPQALCDIAGHFVGKNPAQIPKQVHSLTPAQGPVLQAFQVAQKPQLADAVEQWLQQLVQQLQQGQISPGRDGKLKVYILGRYNAERQYLPSSGKRWEAWLELSFLTIHRSKGAEADYVVLPEMLTLPRGRSFPSTRGDDSILGLAMPTADDYPHAEERRLFYVALTRARRGVVMFSVRGRQSVFLQELAADDAVTVTDMKGIPIEEDACPACGQGVLVWRSGRYGDFRSCSHYPACTYKPRQSERAQSLSS